jgi:hypothetical protein
MELISWRDRIRLARCATFHHCRRKPLQERVYNPGPNYLGEGTAGIAAHSSGRVCLAIEIDPLFVDLAIRRWQVFTGEDAIRESDGVSFATLDPSQLVESAF